VGETLGAYLTRRRVELAAARLASQPRLSVLSAALSVGFGSPEAFARAFRRHFGRTPTQWRGSARGPAAEKSKVDQEDGRWDQEKPREKRYAPAVKKKKSRPLEVSVRTLPAARVAYLRYRGPFGESLGRFWAEEVFPWLASNDLLGLPRYGISRDDPQVTERRKCRYDAGVGVGENFVPSAKAQVGTLPGGRYACARFQGTSREIPHSWERNLREWLPASGYQLDSRAYFEYYPVDGEFDARSGAFTCDLCLPIARL
jgi:AraC family transcriptional regulator